MEQVFLSVEDFLTQFCIFMKTIDMDRVMHREKLKLIWKCLSLRSILKNLNTGKLLIFFCNLKKFSI